MSGNTDVKSSFSTDLLKRLWHMSSWGEAELPSCECNIWTGLTFLDDLSCLNLKLGHAFPSYGGNAPLTCREGHNWNPKSIYVYFQAHDGWLPVQDPEFLQHIRQCCHAVRHSNWYRSTDLVIKLACCGVWRPHGGEGADKLTSKKSVQHKTSSAARQQKDTDDANKIIEYMDSDNPFHVILSLCILLILVLWPINQGLDKKILDNMTDHKVPDLMIKKSYHAVTKYIRLHQIQWS